MKRILNILLIIIITSILFGCNNKELLTISFEDKQFGFITTLSYDKNSDFKFYDGMVDEGQYASMKMTSDKLNIIVDFTYDEETKEQYNINKSSVSIYDGYKEYKYNGYDAYTFSLGDDNLYSVIIFGDSNDEMNTYLYLSFSLIDESIKTNLHEVYSSNSIQKLLSSISYKKIVK